MDKALPDENGPYFAKTVSSTPQIYGFDGKQTVFRVPPGVHPSDTLFLNGLAQCAGFQNDYIFVGDCICFMRAPDAYDVVTFSQPRFQ